MTKTEEPMRGVCQLSNGRWKVVINAMGEFAYLGCFDTVEEANEMRRKAEGAVSKIYPGWKAGVRPENKSGTAGISYCKKDRRWTVTKNGKYIGQFKNLRDAEKRLAKYLKKNPHLA